MADYQGWVTCKRLWRNRQAWRDAILGLPLFSLGLALAMLAPPESWAPMAVMVGAAGTGWLRGTLHRAQELGTMVSAAVRWRMIRWAAWVAAPLIALGVGSEMAPEGLSAWWLAVFIPVLAWAFLRLLHGLLIPAFLALPATGDVSDARRWVRRHLGRLIFSLYMIGLATMIPLALSLPLGGLAVVVGFLAGVSEAHAGTLFILPYTFVGAYVAPYVIGAYAVGEAHLETSSTREEPGGSEAPSVGTSVGD